MFIVCPSCSGPYRIPAEQIAPLVQTACPHCEYRIILDFEAANEPSLREAGHQFAQGFESVEAYASVYDHVASKADAQPRAGVTAVAAFGGQSSGRAPSHSPAPTPTPVAATATPTPRPQPTQPDPEPVATPASTGPASVRSAGSKTVLQVPSKKPVSMDAAATPLASPIVSNAGAAGPSMRPGKGVDVVDDSRPEVDSSERKPPHTPPVASVISSGPAPSEQPTPPPEDIAAQSGPHKTETKPEVKPAEVKPVVKQPEPGGSMTIYIIIVAVVVAAIIAVILLNR